MIAPGKNNLSNSNSDNTFLSQLLILEWKCTLGNFLFALFRIVFDTSWIWYTTVPGTVQERLRGLNLLFASTSAGANRSYYGSSYTSISSRET